MPLEDPIQRTRKVTVVGIIDFGRLRTTQMKQLLEVLHQILPSRRIQLGPKLDESLKFLLELFFCYAGVVCLHGE